MNMHNQTLRSGARQPYRLGGLILALLVIAGATNTIASELKIGDLEIHQPWSRATPKGAKVGAGYLVIKNTGKTADRLIGGEMQAAKRVEVHEMKLDKGIMRMRPLKSGLEILPGQSVALKPGGYHLMFMGLSSAIKKGEPFKATLVFEKAGRVELEFAVSGIGAGAPEHGKHDSHTHGHGHSGHQGKTN